MSRENVELVRATFDAWCCGEIERACLAMDERIEWDIAEDEPDARTVRGVPEVTAMMRGWFESFENFAGTPQEFIDAGDHVVVPIVFTGVPRGGSAPVQIEEAHVATIREGAIASVRAYRTKAEALEAAGISQRAPER